MKKIGLSLFMLTCVLADAEPQAVGNEYSGVTIRQDDTLVTKNLPAIVTVNEGRVVKAFSYDLFGLNHNWTGSDLALMILSNKTPVIRGSYLPLMEGMSMPLNRMSGTVSQVFKWKEAIGSYTNRAVQQNEWGQDIQYKLGPVEWIKSVQAVDHQAAFTWTFNMMSDSPQDCADLVEFLTGDPTNNPNGGINWAQERVNNGLTPPVNMRLWELGNEMDWKHTGLTKEEYVERCKTIIAAVRAVDSNAVFAAHAKTAAYTDSNWRDWHHFVLENLGDDLGYMVIHLYYNGYPVAKLENEYIRVLAQDIIDVTGSDHIKIYVSEHAMWPLSGTDSFERSKPSWRVSHALTGCLATGEWFNRMLNTPEVVAMSYHCFSSGPWGLIFLDEQADQLYSTGMLELFRLFNGIHGENVVEIFQRGVRANIKQDDLSFTCAAITSANGLTLILNNREPETSRSVDFKFSGKYWLAESTTLSAPNLMSVNTVSQRSIVIKRDSFAEQDTFCKYIVPPKSCVVLELKAFGQ